MVGCDQYLVLIVLSLLSASDWKMEKCGRIDREFLMADIDGTFTAMLNGGQALLTLDGDELTDQKVRTFVQMSMVHLARLKMQSRCLHLDLDTERRQRETRRTHVDQLHLVHENLLYQRAHIQREIEKCKDLTTPNTKEIQREMGCSLGTTVYVKNLDEINQATMEVLQNEKEARISMKRKLDQLEEEQAKTAEELSRKRKYLDNIPDQIAKIRATSKDLAEDLTSIVKEIRERNKRKQLEEMERQKKLLQKEENQVEDGSDEQKIGEGKEGEENALMSIDDELVIGDNEDNGLQGIEGI